jgi:hypothetical protein
MGQRGRSAVAALLAFFWTHDQIRVIQCRAIGVREAVAEFAALMDGAGGFRCDVRADVAGKGELLEELLHPLAVFALVRIHLRIAALKIGRPEHARGAVARPRHEDHVEVVALDDPVEMSPYEGQRRAGAPVAKQSVFHVLQLQRLLQQGVVSEVDHPDRQVIACAPPRIDQAQFLAGQGI